MTSNVVPLQIRADRTCQTCGHYHMFVPSDARFLETEDMDGAWQFSCACGTQMIATARKLSSWFAREALGRNLEQQFIGRIVGCPIHSNTPSRYHVAACSCPESA